MTKTLLTKIVTVLGTTLIFFSLVHNTIYATNNVVELQEITEKATEVRPSQIFAMLIGIVIATVIYIVLNCFRKNVKNEKASKVSSVSKWIGIIIIISFFTIATLELLINRTNISIDMNNTIVNILLVAYFIFMSSVVSGIFCYRKYKEVSPMWLNLTYIIGVILLVCLIGNFYSKTNDSQKGYESQMKYLQNSIENRKWN